MEDQDHPRPLMQVLDCTAKQRHELRGSVDETLDCAPDLLRAQRGGITRQHIVAAGLDNQRTWVGPPIRGGCSVAGQGDVLPHERPGPFTEEVVSDCRQLIAGEGKQGVLRPLDWVKPSTDSGAIEPT
jgi:hypothetical protein